MAKADRLAKLDDLRLDLESEYVTALVDALRVTAAGKWGLFDHKGDRWSRAASAPTIEKLEEMAQAIDKVRTQLDLPPFELHLEFLAARGPVGPEAVGEPRQAQAWLERLAAAEKTAH